MKRLLGGKSAPAEELPKGGALAELAGGARVIQLYEDLQERSNDGSITREDFCRAVCQFVGEAMEALIAGAPPAPPKPEDTRPEWAKTKPPLGSPEFLKWRLLSAGRLTIEEIEEVQKAGGSRYFEQMVMHGHSKEWAMREIAERKAAQATKEASLKARWPNRF